MSKEYQTIKIWKRSLKKLRLISAHTGESMVKVVERLVDAELRKVEKREL